MYIALSSGGGWPTNGSLSSSSLLLNGLLVKWRLHIPCGNFSLDLDSLGQLVFQHADALPEGGCLTLLHLQFFSQPMGPALQYVYLL